MKTVNNGDLSCKNQQLCVGPFRVFPGRLSVSRTFGDIEAKLSCFGGNCKVVISEPEIRVFKLMDDQEFIVLASDGVYDKLTNKEIVKAGWDSLEDSNAHNIHQQCGLVVENILRTAINSRSLDNVTVVMICFKAFKEKFKAKQKQILKSTHFSKNENILNVNKNYNNMPMRDERIFNLLKGGSFVAALDNGSAAANNENVLKRSLLEVNNCGKYHRNSIDEKKINEGNNEFNLNKLISKFNDLKVHHNEKKDIFSSVSVRKIEDEKKYKHSHI